MSRAASAGRNTKPLGSSRTDGFANAETARMTGGRSRQTNEEIAMADRVDRLLDDFPRQSRSHPPDAGSLIDVGPSASERFPACERGRHRR